MSEKPVLMTFFKLLPQLIVYQTAVLSLGTYTCLRHGSLPHDEIFMQLNASTL